MSRTPSADRPAAWILKSEPDVFGIDHLMKAKDKCTLWDGVRNYQARNNLVAMQVGDKGYFYHSSCDLIGIAGEVRIAAVAVPDESQFDSQSEYFDAKSTREKPRWFSPKVQGVRKHNGVLPREVLAKTALVKSQLFTHSRLSVIPLTAAEERIVEKLLVTGKLR